MMQLAKGYLGFNLVGASSECATLDGHIQVQDYSRIAPTQLMDFVEVLPKVGIPRTIKIQQMNEILK